MILIDFFTKASCKGTELIEGWYWYDDADDTLVGGPLKMKKMPGSLLKVALHGQMQSNEKAGQDPTGSVLDPSGCVLGPARYV